MTNEEVLALAQTLSSGYCRQLRELYCSPPSNYYVSGLMKAIKEGACPQLVDLQLKL